MAMGRAGAFRLFPDGSSGLGNSDLVFRERQTVWPGVDDNSIALGEFALEDA